MTLQVHQALYPRMAANPGMKFVYESIEMPASAVLGRVERHGVLIDSARAGRAVAHAGRAHAGARERGLRDRRPAVQPRLAQADRRDPVRQAGAAGGQEDGLAARRPPTRACCEKLALDYPLPAKLLEHRGLSKLKGTYTDKLPQMVNPHTGRVHTHYAQAVAITGRLSSNDPNLQNIPIRTPEGRRVREAFIAPPGHVIVSADYSQIELRLMAHISQDPGLLRAFTDGMDVHRATAAEVFNLAAEEVTSEQRRYAKTINFGLIYGMGAFGLSQSLGIEQKAAQATTSTATSRASPASSATWTRPRPRAAETGYVETLFGRRISLPEINGGSGPLRAGAERQAINAPMQGTAADLIKLAMLAVQKALDDEGKATRMVMQVHDELVFEVPEAEVDWVQAEIPRLMAGVAQLSVPLIAEVGVGPNWDEAH